MFADSITKVAKFTRPSVVSRLFFDGSVNYSVGAIVIINNSGWFISVAHLFDVIEIFEKHAQEIADYNMEAGRLTCENTKTNLKKLKRLPVNPKWLKKYYIWPGSNEQQIKDIKIFPENDLFLARLEPFDSASIVEYPTFKNPHANLPVGRSLCNFGYPFFDIDSSVDVNTGVFKMQIKNITMFSIDGIYTRNIELVTVSEKQEQSQAKYLETSSPGLLGQSGGPIFDISGRIWAIQSKTWHHNLGFNPKVKKNGKEVEENQFLNVGWGVHVEVITKFLRDNNIGRL